VQIYPYQAIAVRGRPAALEIRARNHRKRDVTLDVSVVLPNRWQSTPERVRLTVPAGGTAAGRILLTVPADWSGHNGRCAIAADVIADGVYLGQIAEAVVDVQATHDPHTPSLPNERREG
jgi:hypothetical protein